MEWVGRGLNSSDKWRNSENRAYNKSGFVDQSRSCCIVKKDLLQVVVCSVRIGNRNVLRFHVLFFFFLSVEVTSNL